ncbi:MAG TPA: adenylate/guanylate cyclase domain-containing protein [Burkholderiaceae bacterium]
MLQRLPQRLSQLVRGPVRWHAVVGCLIALAMAGEMFGLHAFRTLESRLTDAYMRHHAADFKADPDVIVVDIDDASMRDMEEIAGLWAWPREIHADLLDALNEFAPRAVVFDIAFSERDRKRPKSDARLSESLAAAAPRAYLGATLLPPATVKDTALAPLSKAFGLAQTCDTTSGAPLLLPNAVDPAAWRLGLDNSEIDPDGVLRHYRLRYRVQGCLLPSLPARVAAELGANLPVSDSILMTWPKVPRAHYPYSVLYRRLTEERFGMSDAGLRRMNSDLRGKILVVGSSATSGYDHHLTPLEASYPGVDLLATAIDNLLNGNAAKPVPSWIAYLFGVMLIAALGYCFFRRINPVHSGLGLLLVTVAALWLADQLIPRLWVFQTATPLIFAWLWFLVAAIAAYLRERRAREQAVALFSRFLNPAVVGKLVDQGETVESLSGRSSEITVLFSDIRGFTTLSETHAPQEVVALLNRYFERQVEVIFRHGGTLDKFIGDCIMAFWGAPIGDVAHARHAVEAALEMQEVLEDFKRELQAEGSDLVDFDVGIGVHSGTAVVGFIGAKRKLDYTAIGDTVNLASRVEGLTKGVARVLVSRETVTACAEVPHIEFGLSGAFSVKGRTAKVELYEPRRTERVDA